jgi:GTPase SAR1 family protein
MAHDEAYRNVEQKIEDARQLGAKVLDLSGDDVMGSAKLTELPKSLGQLTQLQTLNLSNNKLIRFPEWLGQLTQLQTLNLSNNELTALPASLVKLSKLEELDVENNALHAIPSWLGSITSLKRLHLYNNPLAELDASLGGLSELEHFCASDFRDQVLPDWLRRNTKIEELAFARTQLRSLPDWLSELNALRKIALTESHLTSLPVSLAQLPSLILIMLDNNPLNPELAAAYKEGLDAVKRYLRAKTDAQVVLNEAKLILIGEGNVGKSSLLGALRGDPWQEGRPTTHGIEIKPIKVTDRDTGLEITLNGWDFGGQRVYRPTHQLFFSAPAVYLVVWEPREGPRQGFVNEWIALVKHREPDAKILVVATHGGPKARQPDIDRQEIWDLFGKEMVLDFFLVESKPDERTQEQKGIADLKQAIARVAASLPEMGRQVPQRWQEVRQALKKTGAAYLPLGDVLKLCYDGKMAEDEAKDFVRISHRLGHLIHYEHDPLLQDVVVLKPDWLSTAMSFVLDDKQTRDGHGLVEFAHLGRLWNDPSRPEESRYDPKLHPLFLRLMERFDLSYKVAVPSEPEDALGFWQRVRKTLGAGRTATTDESKLHYTSLIAQLVPDVRPDPNSRLAYHACERRRAADSDLPHRGDKKRAVSRGGGVILPIDCAPA